MSNEEKNSSKSKEEIKNEGVVKTEQNVQTSTVPSANQSIINTDVVKAKANKAVKIVKNGYNKFNEKMKNEKKFKQFVGIGVVALVIIIVLFYSYLYGGSKGTIKGFTKAYAKMDTKAVIKYLYDDYLDYYDLEDEIDHDFDKYEVLKCELIDEKKIDKDDVDDVAEYLEEYDIDEDDVKAAVVYTIKFKIDDDGDKETFKEKVTAVKIKSKWYIFLEDFS